MALHAADNTITVTINTSWNPNFIAIQCKIHKKIHQRDLLFIRSRNEMEIVDLFLNNLLIT